jgi:hypothetical protein
MAPLFSCALSGFAGLSLSAYKNSKEKQWAAEQRRHLSPTGDGLAGSGAPCLGRTPAMASQPHDLNEKCLTGTVIAQAGMSASAFESTQ